MARERSNPEGHTARPLGLRIVVVIVTALAVLGASAIALFGAWVGSTLAVFHGGPVWLALVGAFACFFLVPLGWELLADRHQVGGRIRDAILRSSVLSLILVAVLLTTHAGSTFKALATRGDWFLAGAKTPAAESIRGFLHGAANKLEWLYGLARTHYGEMVDDTSRTADSVPDPSVSPGSRRIEGQVVPPAGQPRVVEEADERYDSDHVGRVTRYAIAGSELTWPLPAVVHPAVLAMPEDAKASIATVGKYLAAAEPDPLMRVKAVHDFVATWVAYDVEGLDSGTYKQSGRQSASRVFKDRTGVCAGYANLVVAVGKAAGSKIIYIAGDARTASDYSDLARDELPAPGEGHAWNAAEVNGTWYLLDATWNAGHVGDSGFKAKYETTYLFAPPEIMRLSHLPDRPKWQLLADTMDRGTWLRQPLLRPNGAGFGIELLSQSTSLSSVRDQLSGLIKNPGEVWMMAGFEGDEGKDCGPWVPGTGLPYRCELGNVEGRKPLSLFASPVRYSRFEYVGTLLVDPD